MCGIAGIVHFGADAQQLMPAVDAMTAAQVHRGPDAGAVTAENSSDPAVVFGHRRLAIIDLSAAGNQPMRDESTGVSLLYNGEVYNFRDLRVRLEARGHRFQSRTDTEVVLRGYLEWGEGVAAMLRGIFAFAIWDPRVRRLVLVRDQLGVKPLYAYWTQDFVAFASEVRALLASNLIPRKLDLDGVRSYLAYGSVQEPLTLVNGIRSVDSGHFERFDETGRLTRRYYEVPAFGVADRPTNAEMRELLVDAVGSQLVADVPLGAFLSGGVDSTAIAALMREAAAPDVRTFNVCFRGSAGDERHFAHIAATATGAQHSDLELSTADFVRDMSLALAAYDQPSVDGINTWFISRAVHDAGMKVALAGVGGDELFAGYNRFAKALRTERVARAARVVPGAVRCKVGSLIERFAWRENMRAVSTVLQSPLPSYLAVRRLFSARAVEGLLSPELRDGARERWMNVRLAPLARSAPQEDFVNRTSWLEIQTYLLSTLLRDTDQMSMAHSLEVRVPLIDLTLVDTVLRVAGEHKTSDTTPKPLLVEPLEGLLPHECVYREKRGFTLPFAQWLNEAGGAHALDTALLDSSACLHPLDRKAVARVRRDFSLGRMSWSRVWALFVLNDWLTRHRVEM